MKESEIVITFTEEEDREVKISEELYNQIRELARIERKEKLKALSMKLANQAINRRPPPINTTLAPLIDMEVFDE